MFSKFVSSVSSNIHKNYDVQPHPKFHSGPWAVYDAHRRTSAPGTHSSLVSVFVFEKKSLDQAASLRSSSSSSSKTKNEIVFSRLKKEVSLLSRLRHPCLLEVVEPIEESRATLTFVTERVIANLQLLVGGYDDPDGYSDGRSTGSGRQVNELDELEIQSGLSSLTKGLQFLHESANIVHSNLTPQAVYVNNKGDWKIGGFGFGISTKAEGAGPNEGYEFPEYDSRLPRSVQRNLDFLAPEYVMEEKVENTSDMFSLGCIIVAIHNKGRSIINSNQSIHTYRQQIAKLDSLVSSARIPSYLRDTLRQLLIVSPYDRLSASNFQHSPLFDNILMNSIKFLDAFPEKTNAEKNSFLRGFVKILPQFSDRVRQRKILPALLAHVPDMELLPVLLPNIFGITSTMSQLSFSERVLPTVREIIQSKDLPDNVTISLLDSIQHLKEKTTGKEFADDIMPLVYRALEAGTFLQEKALKISGGLVDHLDFITVKTTLFPKVATVFSHTTTLGTKIATLDCFLLIVPKLDNFTMTEKLIPLLRNIKTKEPTVILAALSVYAEMGQKLGHEVVASDILPALWPMTTAVLLNMDQFNRLLNVIRELENKVVTQQTQKLQELGTPSTGVKGATSPSQDSSSLGPMEETTLDFENLVLGKKSVNLMSTSSQPISPPSVQSPPISSPPITAFQTQSFQPTKPALSSSQSRPNTPSFTNIMQPLKTSQTPPPLSSNSFYPPLQPSQYGPSANGGSSSTSSLPQPLSPQNGLFTSPNQGFLPSQPNANPFNSTTWPSNTSQQSGSINFSPPTLAPPPAKPLQPSTTITLPQMGQMRGNTGNTNTGGGADARSGTGLDKYQSLL